MASCGSSGRKRGLRLAELLSNVGRCQSSARRGHKSRPGSKRICAAKNVGKGDGGSGVAHVDWSNKLGTL